MLVWEVEMPPENNVAHHLMVLCYHLQHPSLYSAEALPGAVNLLVDFLVFGHTPSQVRKRIRGIVSSGKRKYKIVGTPGSHGVYAHPVTWTLRARDVVEGGLDHYIDSILAWARATYTALEGSNNLP